MSLLNRLDFMPRICKVFSILLLWFVSIVARAEQIMLDGIDYSNQSGPQVKFKLSTPNAHYRVSTLTNPDRLVVDFPDTRISRSIIQPPAAHVLFNRLRSGEHADKGLRLVIDLKYPVRVVDKLLKTNNGSELQLDLQGKAPVQAKLEKPADPVNPLPVAEVKKIKALKPVDVIAKPVKTSQPVVAKGRDIVVAIDAGHGGKDVGAQGGNGTQEKDVVFAIAKRLEGLVNNQPGMRAVMIRKGDYFVKLQERVHIAHEAKADLFVSIHADAFNDASAHGASVYTLSNKGASSAGARWLADSENAADAVNGNGVVEKNEMLASVLQDLSQTAAKEASQNVGNKVLKSVRSVGHLHRSAVQKAGFVVLKSPDIPSILVETAFISNPEEESHLTSRGYQDKMASAVFGGIMAHFKQYAPANTLFAQLSKTGKVPRLAVVVEDQDDVTAAKPLQMARVTENVSEVCNKSQHVVNWGETLSGIAQQYRISMRSLRLANNMNDGNVKVGGVLQIPRNG